MVVWGTKPNHNKQLQGSWLSKLNWVLRYLWSFFHVLVDPLTVISFLVQVSWSLSSPISQTNHCLFLPPSELQTLTLYRFTDPKSDPFVIPPYPNTCLKPIELDSHFKVDPCTSTVMLNVGGSMISIGDRLVYRSEQNVVNGLTKEVRNSMPADVLQCW